MAKSNDLHALAQACEDDLWTFAQVVEPHRVYGDVHKELFQWMGREDAMENQLVLLPRDHQKSHCAAVFTAWCITRDPALTVIYVSATSTLAEKQLYEIKNLLSSRVYSALWPEMLDREEGKREKWTATEICVDHPLRKSEGVRDSTVFAAGLTTNTTGLHAKLIVKDDVVVPDNAYTEDGRDKTEAACSQLASVLTTGGQELVVGTRYHPHDYYGRIMAMTEEVWDANDEIVDNVPVYEKLERTVETNGVFLWPKTMRDDGKHFGFDRKELARKKAKYLDATQFFAQYYNDPNDPESNRIDRTRFQYYDEARLDNKGGDWYYGNRKLNIFASIDFAMSIKKNSDWTAIVVVGIDHEGYIYVLDMDRFRTTKVEVYFQHILSLHSKWDFRKLRAEVTVAQKAIVEYLKDRARQVGMSMSVDEHRPTRHDGAKEERIAAILEPRYENMTMWHAKAGWTNVLEEELVLARPPHDDLKDALAMAVEICKAPRQQGGDAGNVIPVQFNKRFGGMI